jgi:photosystem II stability/assembly factor-like uncharacterized protein
MKKAKKMIILFLMFIPFIATAQWNYINQGNNGDYKVIKFKNESEGWAMGIDCLIQKTTDGGNTWIQEPCNGNVNIEDFQFVNDSVAYCIGWNATNDKFSEILKYDYLNESWNVSCTLDSIIIRALHFLNPQTGFIVIEGGGIQKTDDGGISWNTVWDAPYVGFYKAYLRDIIFLNDSIGFVCGRLKSENNERRKVILKSIDKGETWDISYIDTTVIDANTIYRLSNAKDNPNVIYASSSHSYFFKTIDCGDTWEIIESAIQKEYKPIFFISADTGYAAATALGTYTWEKVPFEIWRTTDGALTWNLQFTDSAYTQAANSICFINDTIGFVAGFETMLKTENGGLSSGIHLNEEISNKEVKVYPNPTSQFITVEISNIDDRIINLEVSELSGKVLKRKQCISHQPFIHRFDLSELSRGIYLLKIRSENALQVKKFLIY